MRGQEDNNARISEVFIYFVVFEGLKGIGFDGGKGLVVGERVCKGWVGWRGLFGVDLKQVLKRFLRYCRRFEKSAMRVLGEKNFSF